jgi:hypothetical protein
MMRITYVGRICWKLEWTCTDAWGDEDRFPSKAWSDARRVPVGRYGRSRKLRRQHFESEATEVIPLEHLPMIGNQ